MRRLVAIACSAMLALAFVPAGKDQGPTGIAVAQLGKGKAPIGKGKAPPPPPVVTKG